MDSYSQIGQDICVASLHPLPGSFLDIGSGHPSESSDTKGLESLGWTGICIDKSSHDYTSRSCQFICMDAIDALNQIKHGSSFDYVSFDIDDDTTFAIYTFLQRNLEFSIATVEHDKYRLGPTPQEDQHSMLSSAGYVPFITNIRPNWSHVLVFEDWWCHHSVCSKTLADGVTNVEALARVADFTSSLQPVSRH